MHTAFVILVVVGFLFHFMAAVPMTPAPWAGWPKPLAWLCWFIASIIWAVGVGAH
jgi:hypothetical protein